jgi:hypothetical protein
LGTVRQILLDSPDGILFRWRMLYLFYRPARPAGELPYAPKADARKLKKALK